MRRQVVLSVKEAELLHRALTQRWKAGDDPLWAVQRALAAKLASAREWPLECQVCGVAGELVSEEDVFCAVHMPSTRDTGTCCGDPVECMGPCAAGLNVYRSGPTGAAIRGAGDDKGVAPAPTCAATITAPTGRVFVCQRPPTHPSFHGCYEAPGMPYWLNWLPADKDERLSANKPPPSSNGPLSTASNESSDDD
jgi:hypothetical protein